MIHLKTLKAVIFVGTTLGVCAFVYQPDQTRLADLPNRIPEAAPYITAVSQLSSEDFRRMEWLNDVKFLAGPRLAGGVPASGARKFY
jgi:hypothetical protein